MLKIVVCQLPKTRIFYYKYLKFFNEMKKFYQKSSIE